MRPDKSSETRTIKRSTSPSNGGWWGSWCFMPCGWCTYFCFVAMGIGLFVSSLLNSHLFDFHEGWVYVLGVEVAGGMTLRERKPAEPEDQIRKKS
jgi:hypothetical protein